MIRRTIFLLSVLSILCSGCETSLTPTNGDQADNYITFHDIAIVQADTTNIPEQKRERYRLDAEIMSVYYINERDSLQEKLPKKLIDIFYNGLLHVYNSDLKAAELVTKKYDIHVFQRGLSRRIFLTINEGAKWMQAWLNGKLRTGNKAIDQLVEKYEFTLKQVDDYKVLEGYGVVLYSGEPFNQFAVADHFRVLEDIRSASPGFSLGDGNRIKFKMGEDYIKYIFSRGYGDCLSGCISRENWSFKVFRDGTIKFIKKWSGPVT